MSAMIVSTLLEILLRIRPIEALRYCIVCVSTLLEILPHQGAISGLLRARHLLVSTLLEILHSASIG